MEKNYLPAEPDKVNETPATEAPLTQTKPSAVKNKVLMAAVAITIVLVLAVAAIAFFWKKSQTPIPLSSVRPEAINETTPEATPAAAETIQTVTPIKVDTSDWAVYTDNQAGFSFKYPPTLVAVNSPTLDENQLSLSVVAEKLAEIPEDLPSFMGRKDALAEKTLLAKGEGKTFVKIGSLYGNPSFTYSMFEVCSVMFVRKLTFYPGDYRVRLTLTAPEAKMTAAMPDFFKIDPSQCGNNLMWNQDKKSDFETTLAQHQGQGLAQTWYDTFYGIVGTVQLVTPVVSPVSSPLPVSSIAPAESPAPVSNGLTYKNDTYGFELTYEKPYRVLTSKDDLYGYPKGVALLYTGGQAYNIVIEVWDTQAAYEKEYEFRLADVKVIKNKGKFITFLNNNPDSAENKKIIDSVKVLP